MTSLAKCPPPPRAAFPHPKRGQYPPSTTRRDRRKLVIQKRRFVAEATTAMTAMTNTDEVEENRQDPRKLLLPTRSRHGRGTASTFPDAFSFLVSGSDPAPPRRLTQNRFSTPTPLSHPLKTRTEGNGTRLELLVDQEDLTVTADHAVSKHAAAKSDPTKQGHVGGVRNPPP